MISKERSQEEERTVVAIGNSRSNNRASARDGKEAEVAGGGRRGEG